VRLALAGVNSLEDVVLAALAMVLSSWTARRQVLVAVEHNGRHELDTLDASRTVGFFTVTYPLLIEIGPEAAPRASLEAVVAQHREVRSRAAGYEQLRWLGPPALQRTFAGGDPDVIVNFLGRFDEPWSGSPWLGIASESCGSLRDPDTPRPHALAVESHVRGARLHIHWHYGTRHEQATIDELATRHAEHVDRLLADVAGPVGAQGAMNRPSGD
jgi:non-ribosomal peptide synthase protein (TIGR01720 family)